MTRCKIHKKTIIDEKNHCVDCKPEKAKKIVEE